MEYKPPVQVNMEHAYNIIREGIQDKIITSAIQAIDIEVDREELIKALNYDRNQYKKGYSDALRDIRIRIEKVIDEMESEV